MPKIAIRFTASAGGARAKAILGYNCKTKEIISGVKRELKKDFEHYLIKFDMARDDGSSSDYTKLEYLCLNRSIRTAGSVEIRTVN